MVFVKKFDVPTCTVCIFLMKPTRYTLLLICLFNFYQRMHFYVIKILYKQLTYVTLFAPTRFNPKGSSSGSQIFLVKLLMKL